MKVYELKSSTHDEILNVYKFVDEQDEKLFMNRNLGIPRRIREEWKKIELTKVEGRIPGDFIFLESGKGLFFNEKALAVLSKYFENCEILDIYVDREKHYYINVLELVDCLDKENCDYTAKEVEKDAWIVLIYKYALLKDKLKEKDIFRIKMDTVWKNIKPKMDVFVSERFKQTVEEAGLNGFKFVEVPVR